MRTFRMSITLIALAFLLAISTGFAAYIFTDSETSQVAASEPDIGYITAMDLATPVPDELKRVPDVPPPPPTAEPTETVEAPAAAAAVEEPTETAEEFASTLQRSDAYSYAPATAPTAVPTVVPTVVPAVVPTAVATEAPAPAVQSAATGTTLQQWIAASPWPQALWARVERIVMCESSGNPSAVSPAGYVGLMQVAPWLHGPVSADPVAQLAQGYQVYLQQGFGAWPVCGA
jgi:hypothetical protein